MNTKGVVVAGERGTDNAALLVKTIAGGYGM